ncbi:hypothetical protein K439DRAFT_1616641 [Ramaria rubella]|nr:hypothetical protein K439DRAFT_1616641 [Ramaria rubella]
MGIPSADSDIRFPWISPGYGSGLWDTQNPHINTVDEGDRSIILLAAIAVSLKRPPHIFSAGNDLELHNIKIPLLRASHSRPLQSSIVTRYPSLLPTVHRWREEYQWGILRVCTEALLCCVVACSCFASTG